jgi:pimeloyl-ACP methyl ester carboxylesterase
MRFMYLHGFASGPGSRKALAFRDALPQRGFSLEIPDLAQGDFGHLTISGQLRVIEDALNGEPCRLIGSSMGGYLASLYAAAHPEVDRLVLLAPAFGFAERWASMQGVRTIERWRETGWLEVFHYGDRAARTVHYGLLEDALKFPGFPDFGQPALIFHGAEDATVSVDLSRRFAASHPNVRLRERDSDHELLNVLSEIVAEAVPFLLGEGFQSEKKSLDS